MPQSYTGGCSDRAPKRGHEGRTKLVFKRNRFGPHDRWLVNITRNGLSPPMRAEYVHKILRSTLHTAPCHCVH